MTTDPWTSRDPEPGDFDATLESIDAAFVEHRDGDPQSSIRIALSAEPWSAFAASLDRPAEPKAAIRELFERPRPE